MLRTKTLLPIIYILSSAIVVKAGVFYSFELPGADLDLPRVTLAFPIQGVRPGQGESL
jgi:hypothetical protein